MRPILFNSLKSLPRTVWLIGFISFINDTASELLYPLIPLYLTSTLLAGPKTLGLIEGIAEATSSILKLFSGFIADKTRKTKIWIVWGYFLAGFGRPLIAFANSWIWILLIRFTDRVGKGLRSSPRDALLAINVAKKHHGLAFGLHRSMDNAGAILGPLLAAFLMANNVPIKDIFIWAIVPGILTFILTLYLKEPPQKLPQQNIKFSWTLKGLPLTYKRYLFVVGIFTLGSASDMFLLLRARELGVSLYQIPILWASVSLVATLFSTPLASLSDNYGRKNLILIGWTCYAAIFILMGFAVMSITSVFLLFALFGLFKASTEGVEKALVADMAPKGKMGTAFGWFNFMSGLMLFPASFIFGTLYESYGPHIAFNFSAACASIATVLMATWVFKQSKSI